MIRPTRKSQLFVLVLSLGIWSLIGSIFAQGDDEKIELAKQVMDLLKQDHYLENAINKAVQATPADQRRAVEQAVFKIDKDAIYAGWAKKAEEIYTIEELKAYLEYASTDIGRSTLRKSAEYGVAMHEVLVTKIIEAASK